MAGNGFFKAFLTSEKRNWGLAASVGRAMEPLPHRDERAHFPKYFSVIGLTKGDGFKRSAVDACF